MAVYPDQAANDTVILQRLFKTEAGEELEIINGIIPGLEDNPDDLETLHKLFRHIHNLKGSAGLIGLTALKEALHQAEEMLDAVRKGRACLGQDQIRNLRRFLDEVENYIEAGCFQEPELGAEGLSKWKEIFAGYGPGPIPSSRENIDAVLALNDAEKAEIAQWQEDGKYVYSLELHFTEKSELQGASALIFWKFIQEYGKVFKAAPALEKLRDFNFPVFKMALLVEKPFSPEIEQKILSYPLYEVKSILIRQWVHRPAESRSQAKLEHWYENTIRVDVAKIERLRRQMVDLLTVQAVLSRLYQRRLPDWTLWEQIGREIRRLENITGALQMEIVRLWLIPARQLFFRFSKLVRELAEDKGKMVELSFEGEEVEIDKQIADKITNSLNHLIRNAVDHGLETSAERRSLGKPQTGQIILGVTQKPDQVIFYVSDDGRGLELEKIKARAGQDGLIGPGRELTEDDIVQFIFLPGFSTSETVTDLSGRGAGLDVVASSVRELHGRIEVDTNPGKGTVFRLIIPNCSQLTV
ncbi:MAG: Hpt domain-containing protein [Firmicutes bacterium]|nr:Hpt domain-containing protein [Bacillota bacterium]